jgi:hypothetical protein
MDSVETIRNYRLSKESAGCKQPFAPAIGLKDLPGTDFKSGSGATCESAGNSFASARDLALNQSLPGQETRRLTAV